MDTKKLNALLNKVVELNVPDELYCKGFLYRDRHGRYYIRVVDVMRGDLSYKDDYYLTEGQDEHITKAEKPKLMRISLKSWHYRLIKYVLKSSAPTPQTMQNGCPYFWLLIFSMVAVSFIILGKAIFFTVALIPRAFFWFMERMVENWIAGLDESQAYEYYYHGKYSSDFKLPMTAKLIRSDDDRNKFVSDFISRKYNIDRESNPEAFEKAFQNMEARWEEWRKERNAIRAKQEEERRVRLAKLDRILAERKRKSDLRKARWEAIVNPIKEAFDKFFSRDWKNIIRRTKQIVGAVITLLLLVATYYVVNVIALGLMLFIDFVTINWLVIVIILGILVVLAAIAGLGILITSWVQSLVGKYNAGRKMWYVELAMYTVYYPIKYIALGVFYTGMYILWIPIKFIFYTVLCRYFLFPIAMFIAKVGRALYYGVLGSTGIFGEYFNASYSDYCPGIEWADTEDDSK